MTAYQALHAFYRPNPDPELAKKSDKDVLVLAGDVVELDEEYAKSYVESGAIEKVEAKEQSDREPEQPAPAVSAEQFAALSAARPGNNASTADWLAYAQTVPGLEPLPADTKRDDVITAVDRRLAEINDELPG